jgi:small subunit ribosomal protein S1
MSSEEIKQSESEGQKTAALGTEETNPVGTAPAAEQPETTAHLEEEQSTGEMDFGAILDQFEQESAQYSPGQVVQGKVVGVSDTGVVIDFGYKSEGVASIAEFTSPEGEVTVKRDDEVEVVIKNMNGGDGSPVLSYADAQRRKSWDALEEAFNKEENVTGRVTGRIKGGVKVDLNGVEAFLPASQIDSRPVGNLDEYIGQEIESKIIKFSRRKGNVVLSRKVIVDEVIGAQKKETLGQLEEGFIVEGKVKSLTDYGAFVDLGGLDGLLHVTDMSWGKVQKPADMLKAGEQVQVKVLKLDREHEKISLGLKQLTADPWTSVEERYPVGSNVKGKVSSLTDYGAFVELEPGIEGLIHISQMSWSKRSKHPNKLLSLGQEVEVRILDINPSDRRISLSLKQLMDNPWDSLRERYQVGTKVTGKVRNLTDFGAFIEIEDGVDGLVHVTDISWSKRVKHPKDVLKKGQEVEAVVTNIDSVNQRMSLSMKDLTPSSWDTFVQQHKPGDVVKGKISRFASFGVFVELGDELEGLCHISELSDDKVDKPEDVVQIGQEMDFKILRIDADAGKIGLSARAVGKEDEPEFDAKSYSTEAKGGMASLAELANLQFGNSGSDEEEK